MSITNHYRSPANQGNSVVANVAVGVTPTLRLKGGASYSVAVISTSSLAFKMQGKVGPNDWIDIAAGVTPSANTVEWGNCIGFSEVRVVPTAGTGLIVFTLSAAVLGGAGGSSSGGGDATAANQSTMITSLQLIDDGVHAEDDAHSSGHKGFMALAVRRDTAAVGSGTDGDYSTLNVDSTGNLRVTLAAATETPGVVASFRVDEDIDDDENLIQECASFMSVVAHVTATTGLTGVWEGTMDDVAVVTEASADWYPLPSLVANTSGVTQYDPGATITPSADDLLAAALCNSRYYRFRRTAGLGVASDSRSTQLLSEITQAAVTVINPGGTNTRDPSLVRDDGSWTPAAVNSWVSMAGFVADETASDAVGEGDAGAARMTLDRKQINASDALVSTNQYLAASGPVLREVAITFSMAAEAHSAGDVLADSQIIATCVRANDAKGYLVGFQLNDEDDQAAAQIDVVFLSANVSIGTEGSAVSVTDANARNILGIISVASTDWVDMINCKIATKTMSNPMAAGSGGLPLPIIPVSGTDDIYVALIARGTPTPTASGMTGRFFFADGL